MGFDLSGIQVLWLSKDNGFKASLQKKGSAADTNDPAFHNYLREEIKLGKILLRSDLKVIRV